MARIPNAPTPEFSCFAEFWQHYLSQHRHPLNRALHALGTVGGLVCLGLAACFSWTWALAVLPVGYGLAWLGHSLIERNRPLTFDFPWWSLRADYKLVGMLLVGRLHSAAEMPSAREV